MIICDLAICLKEDSPKDKYLIHYDSSYYSSRSLILPGIFADNHLSVCILSVVTESHLSIFAHVTFSAAYDGIDSAPKSSRRGAAGVAGSGNGQMRRRRGMAGGDGRRKKP